MQFDRVQTQAEKAVYARALLLRTDNLNSWDHVPKAERSKLRSLLETLAKGG